MRAEPGRRLMRYSHVGGQFADDYAAQMVAAVKTVVAATP